MKTLLKVAVGCLLSVFFNLAITHAAPMLQFQLTGATNVTVLGTQYDVAFIEGSCETIFFECGGTIAPFAFNDFTSARFAAFVLLQDVFLDVPGGPQIDAIPSLTNGCDSTSCYIMTPFDFETFMSEIFVFSETFINLPGPLFPFNEIMSEGNQFGPDFDTTADPERVYAVWSVVPEPNTLLLMGSGLVGLLALRKRIQTHGSS